MNKATMSSTQKVLLAVLVLVLLVAGFRWLDANVFVSAEMNELRSIEARLDLPPHLGRSEDDAGENTDWKGARHNDRRILLHFGYRDSMDDIVSILERNGWVLERKTERETPVSGPGAIVTGETSWRFTSEIEPACVSIWHDWESSGDISDSGLFIFHSSSDACG